MFKKAAFIVVMLIVLSGCNDSTVDNSNEQLSPSPKLSVFEQYQQQAEILLLSIRTKSPGERIAQNADQLVNYAHPLLAKFIQSHPNCEAYLVALTQLIVNNERTSDMQVNEMLAKQALPVFDEPVCYHAKALLTHPVKIHRRALLGMETEDAYALAEMTTVELMAHYDVVTADIIIQ